MNVLQICGGCWLLLERDEVLGLRQLNSPISGRAVVSSWLLMLDSLFMLEDPEGEQIQNAGTDKCTKEP